MHGRLIPEKWVTDFQKLLMYLEKILGAATLLSLAQILLLLLAKVHAVSVYKNQSYKNRR